MAYLRCHSCNGSKETMGMGMLMKKCEECKATGFCEYEDLDQPNTSIKLADKPKRGRKPKFNTDVANDKTVET